MKHSAKPNVIFLMGPTAAGKTNTAVFLAQQLPLDLISVDSSLVYKGMDIGTAKPSRAELKITPHKLVSIREPTAPYSAADFCKDAKYEINQILAARKQGTDHGYHTHPALFLTGRPLLPGETRRFNIWLISS